MELEPLEQWICDTCGELIAEAKDGWLEWQRKERPDGSYGRFAFRICHHLLASPRKKENPEGCYRNKQSHNHLREFLGPDGLTAFVGMIERGEIDDLKNWAEIVRRLFTPGYEEARQHFREAVEEGLLEDVDEGRMATVETLARITNDFRNREDE
jgi:hypothetical protein